MPRYDHDHSPGIRDSLAQVEEILEKLAGDLAALVLVSGEGNVPSPLINAVFRDAHSLKGVAGMLGYTEVSGLAHGLENLLEQLRLGKSPLDAVSLEILEASLDHLSLLVRLSCRGDALPDSSLILKRIAACCARTISLPTFLPPVPLLPERVAAALNEFEKHRLAESIRRGARLFLLHASFLLESFDKEIENLMDGLKSRGEVISTIPTPGFERDDAIDFDILVAADEAPGALPSGITCEEIPVAAAPAHPCAGEPVISPLSTSSPDRMRSERSGSGTVRVDIRALDELIALVGELVAGQRSLGNEVAQAIVVAPALVKRAERLGKKLRELQQGVMEIRMVPLRTLYDKLTRIVRRISLDEGRNLELELHGGETRIDKQIIDDLFDPLMHLVRNAVDHGIEGAAERRSAGKSETGRIIVTAGQKGNRVVIQVADDGRGINLAKVRRRAAALGLLQQPDTMPDPEALELIFEPGFSTSDVISELSGRGVGMDVVKNAITALSGELSVESESGYGSRIIISLPLTLAIVKTLIIEVGGASYGVPVSAIQEMVAVTPEEFVSLEGNPWLSLREMTIPLVRLDHFFDRNSAPWDDFSGYAVVTGTSSRRVGIMADGIRGEHDLVLKPLGELFSGVRGIAGALDLSDDETILLLDPMAIVDEFCRGGSGRGF